MRRLAWWTAVMVLATVNVGLVAFVAWAAERLIGMDFVHTFAFTLAFDVAIQRYAPLVREMERGTPVEEP